MGRRQCSGRESLCISTKQGEATDINYTKREKEKETLGQKLFSPKDEVLWNTLRQRKELLVSQIKDNLLTRGENIHEKQQNITLGNRIIYFLTGIANRPIHEKQHYFGRGQDDSRTVSMGTITN